MFSSQNQNDNSLSFKVIKIFKEDESKPENLEGSSSSTHLLQIIQIIEEFIFATLEN